MELSSLSVVCDVVSGGCEAKSTMPLFAMLQLRIRLVLE